MEALARKKVIGASAGENHTAAWTDSRELFTFGRGGNGQLGHGGEQQGRVPRLVEALVGKKVIGASAGYFHTAVWTEEGELFTLGYGDGGKLGHGGHQTELVARLVEALSGKKVVGAAGQNHTWCGLSKESCSPLGMETLGRGAGGEEADRCIGM